MMQRKIIRKYHIIGSIFTILIGTSLHFTFELSANWKPVALISAVNESIWEHMKLAFWPTLIFAIIEFFIYGKRTKNFLFGKTMSLYLMSFLIPIIFWSYTRIIKDSLIWDILDFIVSVIIGYLVSYYITVSEKYYVLWKYVSLILIIIIIIAFSLFTYFPILKYPLFKDPISGGFGIIN